MKLFLLSGLTSLLFAFISFQPGDPLKPERPADPWVYYTNLDTQESVLAIGLDKRFWLAFDTSLCSNYKLWAGLGIVKKNGIENPVSEGVPFDLNTDQKTRWQVLQNGKEVSISSRFSKFEILEERLWMSYDLMLPDGGKISMKESPEYVPRKKDDGNRFVYERIFQVDSIPANTDIFLKIACESMMFGGDVKTSGKFSNDKKTKFHFEWGTTYDFSGDLKLNTDKETVLRLIYTLDPERKASKN